MRVRCDPGWGGPRCDDCVRMPGCVHGTCHQPWQCTCMDGWTGRFCDKGDFIIHECKWFNHDTLFDLTALFCPCRYLRVFQRGAVSERSYLCSGWLGGISVLMSWGFSWTGLWIKNRAMPKDQVSSVFIITLIINTFIFICHIRLKMSNP